MVTFLMFYLQVGTLSWILNLTSPEEILMVSEQISLDHVQL